MLFFEIVVPQSLDPARYVFFAGFAAAGPMAIPTVCSGSAPADRPIFRWCEH